MVDDAQRSELVAALRGYLEELQDSGVDGLPLVAEAPAAYSRPGSPPMSPAANDQLREAADNETLETIRAELGDCQRCDLGKSRTSLVFGSGDPRARLVMVGEAPGPDEDRQGEPFVGEAGQLLTKIIQAMGFKRSEVYLCTLLKCHPPESRSPHVGEIEQCQSFLLRQIRAIGPQVVVALGTFAAQTLLATKEPISRLRGEFHDFHGIPLMPTFHPAFLLRSPERKREVWSDMQQVMKLLGKEPVPKK